MPVDPSERARQLAARGNWWPPRRRLVATGLRSSRKPRKEDIMDSRTLWVLQARAAAYAWYAGHDPPETPRAARAAGLAVFEQDGGPDAVQPACEPAWRVAAARRVYYAQQRYRRAARRLQAQEWRARTTASRALRSGAAQAGRARS